MGTIIFIVAPSLVWTLFQLPSKFSHETCTRKGTSFLSVARLATNPTSLDHSTAWPCRSNSTAWARLPHKSSTAHMATCSAAAFYALNHIVNNRLHLCECARHLHDSAVNPARILVERSQPNIRHKPWPRICYMRLIISSKSNIIVYHHEHQ